MNLRTIWTTPAMSFKEKILRSRESIARSVAWMLPLRIRYWVTMQMIGRATQYSSNIPATPFDEILKNLDRPKNVH